MNVTQLVGAFLLSSVLCSCAILADDNDPKPGRISFGVSAPTHIGETGRSVTLTLKNQATDEVTTHKIPFNMGLRVVYIENLTPGRYVIEKFTGKQSAHIEPWTVESGVGIVVEPSHTTLSPIAIRLESAYLYWSIREIEDESYWDNFNLNE